MNKKELKATLELGHSIVDKLESEVNKMKDIIAEPVEKDELLRTEQDLRKDIGRLDRQIDWVKEDVEEMNRNIRVLNEHRDAVRYSLTVIAGIVVFTLVIIGVASLMGA